ncbi:MAG: hypothetical protein RMM17_06060 [Acidobacteriota bacterium]|nr:hypothetical protein [Blastocatellia bacterium]MDW8412232.1 hypothetical protein [Acidobacteriota bacterium]
MVEEKKSSQLLGILKHLLLATIAAAVVLWVYLNIVNTETPDKNVGRYAYMLSNGSYMGKIRGIGRSAKISAKVYYIEEPTGGVIEIPVKDVEVRDKPFYDK